MSFEHVFTFIVSVDYMKIFKTLSPCNRTVNLYCGSCSFHFIVFCVCVWLFAHPIGCLVFISAYFIIIKKTVKNIKYFYFHVFRQVRHAAHARPKTIKHKHQCNTRSSFWHQQDTCARSDYQIKSRDHAQDLRLVLTKKTWVRHNTQFWRKQDTYVSGRVSRSLANQRIKQLRHAEYQTSDIHFIQKPFLL